MSRVHRVYSKQIQLKKIVNKFAHIQTGVGTLVTSSTFYGPFNNPKESDVFVKKVRKAFSKLHDTSPMAISMIGKIPKGRAAIPPKHFRGFMRIGLENKS